MGGDSAPSAKLATLPISIPAPAWGATAKIHIINAFFTVFFMNIYQNHGNIFSISLYIPVNKSKYLAPTFSLFMFGIGMRGFKTSVPLPFEPRIVSPLSRFCVHRSYPIDRIEQNPISNQ